MKNRCVTCGFLKIFVKDKPLISCVHCMRKGRREKERKKRNKERERESERKIFYVISIVVIGLKLH